MEELLKLRGSSEPNLARWAAIFEKNFKLTLPLTSYRSMISPNKEENTYTKDARTEQILHGAEEAKSDSCLLASFLERLYFLDEKSCTPAEKRVTLSYDCNRNEFFMDGTTAFMNWSATTKFIQSNINFPHFRVNGVLQASFCPASNKLTSARLSFDTNSVLSQVNRIESMIHTDLVSVKSCHDAAAEADAILDSLEMPYFLPTSTGDISHNCIPAAPVSSSENSESENEEEQ